MLKEQNVIKLLLSVTLFCLSINLYCQKKIIGKYSSLMLYQGYYNSFDFNENEIFEYHSGADLGDDKFGKGHYQIKNDSLILNYDLTKLKQESYFKIKKYYNSKDSIKVNLNIYSFDEEPLYNIIVYSFPNYQSTESDKQGVAYLKFKKGLYKAKVELHIDGEFWAKQVIFLNSDTNYNIDVFMNKSVIQGFGHPKALKNQIIKYKIIEHTNNFIKLKNNSEVIKLIRQSE